MVKRIWYWLTRYRLTKEEYIIWLKIKGKAKRGFREWYGETKGNDLCGPWIPDLTNEEYILLNKIYNKFNTDGGWISALSISRLQEAYIKFDHIRKKVYK